MTEHIPMLAVWAALALLFMFGLGVIEVLSVWAVKRLAEPAPGFVRRR